MFSFILDDKWGRWIGRWTAEEHLHAVALRNYLVVTREIDPAANEDVPRRARDEGLPRRHLHARSSALVFMAFFEREHAVFCRNLEAQITEPVLKSLIGRIARDEERHEEFFANLVAHCLDLQPRRDDRGDRAPRSRTRRRRWGHRRVRGQGRAHGRGRHLRPEQLRQVIVRPHHRVGARRRARAARLRVTSSQPRRACTARSAQRE